MSFTKNACMLTNIHPSLLHHLQMYSMMSSKALTIVGCSHHVWNDQALSRIERFSSFQSPVNMHTFMLWSFSIKWEYVHVLKCGEQPAPQRLVA